MKLVTFAAPAPTAAATRLGAYLADDAVVVDLQAAARAADGRPSPWLDDMLAFLDGGPAAREAAERLVDFACSQRPPDALLPIQTVRLLAPLPRPRSLRDCMAFQRHLVQATRTVIGWRCRPLATLDRWVERLTGSPLVRLPPVWYERPLYYKGNPHSVVGPEADVVWPSYTERLDFELELGIVIGRRGSDIAPHQAGHYIAGYTIFNDFSARDVQLREMQGRLGPAKGKDFDTGNVLGPWLVTPDELGDPYNLHMTARVNGQSWCRGSSRDMHYTFEQIIAYISQNETLYPGEFIGSGTVPDGCGLELDRWIQPGDVVELEVAGLGTLRNRVVRHLPAGDAPLPSRPA